MSKKERLIEWGKTAFIVLLVLCTIILLRETKYYNNAFEFISSVFISTRDSIQDTDKVDADTESGASVYPMAISVSIGSGNRYASVYDMSAVEADYQRFSALLGEALGSSGEPVKTDKNTWQNAIERESVYIQFLSPQHLAALSGLLGTSMGSSAGQAMSEMLCLSCETESVRLYYVGHDGGFFYCETGVSADTLRARLGEFVPNGAAFSHEMPALSKLGSSMLVPAELPDIYSVTLSGTASQLRMKELLFSPLGLNEYTVSEYSETDGTVVYLDGSNTLRISPNGISEYSNDGKDGIRLASDSVSSALNLCWRIAGASIGSFSDSADIYVSEIACGQTGEYRIVFDYAVNSLPMMLGENKHAAEFVIVDGILQTASLCFRSYSIGEDTLEVLPVLQAAAIASANGNESIKLVYSETGEGINCIWVPQ